MKNMVTKSLAGLTGATLMVAMTYLLDPDNGRRRRSALGAQCRKAGAGIKERARDVNDGLSHQYQKASSRARSWFNGRNRMNRGLVRAIRMDLRRAVPSSTGVGVLAQGDKVILHGDVLAQEHDHVLDVVRSVRGVSDVADHLADIAETAPQKIGPRLRQGLTSMRDELTEPHWSSSTRMGTGAVGLALLRWAATQRNLYGGVGALAGAALVARSVFNKPLRELATKKGIADARETVATASRRAASAADDLADAAAERRERVGEPYTRSRIRNQRARKTAQSH